MRKKVLVIGKFHCCSPHAILASALVSILLIGSSVSFATGQTCPATAQNLILDGGFEAGGIPSTIWDPETSTNFGTPLCDNASCGTGGGASPPRTGLIWAWFGGIPAPETATLGQTVTTTLPTLATLRFWMRTGTVSSPFTDVLNVRVNGVIVQSFPEPTVAEGAYTERTINLGLLAPSSYSILFEYIGPSSGTGSYVVDDVTFNVCLPTATTASLSGRVLAFNGRGLANTPVTLTNQFGVTRTASTNIFGYYRFDDVPVGLSYVLQPVSSRFTFSPQVITLDDDLEGVNFVSEQ